MKKTLLLIAIFIFANHLYSQDKIITPEEFLNEVFEIVEKESLNKDSIDFQKIKRAAFSKLKYVDSIEDCYPIIQLILYQLEDSHSFFMTKEQVKNWESTSKSTDSKKLDPFNGKLLSGNIGYIQMNGFSSGDPISIQKYADSLQYLIKTIDNPNLKGWILDLRKNSGGNCWPMLTGLGPLLGNGICGYFMNNNREKTSWFYYNGASGIDNKTMAKVSKQPYELLNKSVPIAVLTGSSTGSSGEVVVTSFHNKINTKSFGENTAGYSTGNSNFKLSDGAMILLTTSKYVDRKGIVFEGKIEPDEIIPFSYQSIGKPDDPVILKAVDWINERN